MNPTPEYLNVLLTLVKQRLGIISNVRDTYLEARILASLQSLTFERNVTINEKDMNLTLFIADYTVWQYQSVNITSYTLSGRKMPDDLRARLNNILMKYTGGSLNV